MVVGRFQSVWLESPPPYHVGRRQWLDGFESAYFSVRHPSRLNHSWEREQVSEDGIDEITSGDGVLVSTSFEIMSPVVTDDADLMRPVGKRLRDNVVLSQLDNLLV